MAFELYIAFIAASAILILIPGPNVALIVANSLAHGQRYALMTVAGTSSAMIIQLGLVIAGMTTMMAEMAHWFTIFKWAGVAYLLYIGIQYWRMPAADLSVNEDRKTKTYRSVFAQGFLISLTNPKTLIFYAAFFPQFMTPATPALPQFLLLGATFLLMAVVSDGAYALLAGRIRPWLQTSKISQIQNKVTGSLLMLCAAGVALTRRGS
jgi:homoserine/homoserine lactone efflux protein